MALPLTFCFNRASIFSSKVSFYIHLILRIIEFPLRIFVSLLLGVFNRALRSQFLVKINDFFGVRFC